MQILIYLMSDGKWLQKFGLWFWICFEMYINIVSVSVCLFVFYVPSTARSFRDGTPIYCPLRRTWSSVNTPFPPGIEPRTVAWQGFDSRWERCIYRASRPSQGTVNGGAVSKWPRCWRDVKHKQTNRNRDNVNIHFKTNSKSKTKLLKSFSIRHQINQDLHLDKLKYLCTWLWVAKGVQKKFKSITYNLWTVYEQ